MMFHVMVQMKRRLPFTAFELFDGRVYSVCWEDCIQCAKAHHREFVKERLASHLVGLFHEKRRQKGSSHAVGSGAPRLSKTRFGKPILISDQHSALTLSFSYVQADAWGAISELPWVCGVDAASVRDFDDKFPVEKVFSPDEFEAGRLVEKDRNSVIALLWSAKESVVKAVGCGFHLIPPRAIELRIVSASPDILNVVVSLPKRSGGRGLLCASTNVDVVSFRRGRAWISVALRRETRPARASSS